MIVLPAEVRSAPARLPISYEAAKNALSNCASIDECQDWANKAEALASYAKQADDDTLRKLADRIQARAVRRCGELLKQYDARGGDRSKSAVAPTFAPSRQQVATDAGMSRHQQVTAVRVANVPLATFEEAVEAEAPLTVTKLAEIGKQPRAPARDPEPVEQAPAGFKEATTTRGFLKQYSEWCQKTPAELAANGFMNSEVAEMKRCIGIIDRWHDRLIVNLKGD